MPLSQVSRRDKVSIIDSPLSHPAGSSEESSTAFSEEPLATDSKQSLATCSEQSSTVPLSEHDDLIPVELWAPNHGLCNDDAFLSGNEVDGVQVGGAVIDRTEVPSRFLLPSCSASVSSLAVDIRFTNQAVGSDKLSSKSVPIQVYSAMSSSVLNGGIQAVERYVNLHVSKECIIGKRSIASVFKEYFDAADKQLTEKIESKESDVSDSRIIGMMTAASMRSCRFAVANIFEHKISVMVTTGLGNLRCAGDRAEYRELYSKLDEIGTINIVVSTTAYLTPTAKIEALMMATEAKVAALTSLNLKSAVSDLPATGTGTDSVALISPSSLPVSGLSKNDAPQNYRPKEAKQSVQFVGKHTVFGETLARLISAAICDSAID